MKKYIFATIFAAACYFMATSSASAQIYGYYNTRVNPFLGTYSNYNYMANPYGYSQFNRTGVALTPWGYNTYNYGGYNIQPFMPGPVSSVYVGPTGQAFFGPGTGMYNMYGPQRAMRFGR